MLEQELKDIWRKSSQTEQIKFDISQLQKDFEMNLKTAEKRVIHRDRREIVVAVLTMVLFAYFTYEVPFFWSKVTSVLCVICFGFLIYTLMKNRKTKTPPSPSASYCELLANEEAYMKRQANLLDSVLYWYVIPLLGAQALFVWSLRDPSAYGWTSFWANLLPTSLYEKIIITIAFIIMGTFIVWLNKKAVKITWNPLIKQVQKIREDLEST